MADERARRDVNRVTASLAVTNDSAQELRELRVDPTTGRLLVTGTTTNFPGLIDFSYDYVGATYPDAVTEVYVFKDGGSGGTTVGTITIVYTDSTKANLSSATLT